MIGVEVRHEHGADQGSVTPEPRLHGEPGPPQLAMHALAAVDEVGGVVDHDGIGVARAGGFRGRATGGAEQHEAMGRLAAAWLAPAAEHGTPVRPVDGAASGFGYGTKCVSGEAHGPVTLSRHQAT